MSTDRVIRWRKNKKPTKEQIGMVCEDYVSRIGTVRWDEARGRYYISLPGPCSHPLRRMPGIGAVGHVYDPPPPGSDEPPFIRWIEVYIPEKEDYLNIMTRHQDPITNAIAERLAEIFAGFWNGKRDP